MYGWKENILPKQHIVHCLPMPLTNWHTRSVLLLLRLELCDPDNKEVDFVADASPDLCNVHVLPIVQHVTKEKTF